MTQKIEKWGDSLAVRIPQLLAAQLQIDEGTSFSLYIENQSLVLCKEQRRPQYTLEDVLASINPNDLHPETDWGADMGHEILEPYAHPMDNGAAS